MNMDKNTIDELKTAHGHELVLVRAAGAELVVRPPTTAEYRRAMDKIGEGERRRVPALEELGRCCCVYPDKAALSALLEQKPGLALTLGGKALELSGVVESDAEKL